MDENNSDINCSGCIGSSGNGCIFEMDQYTPESRISIILNNGMQFDNLIMSACEVNGSGAKVTFTQCHHGRTFSKLTLAVESIGAVITGPYTCEVTGPCRCDIGHKEIS